MAEKQVEPGTERAPKGTWTNAPLVLPYFRIESRTARVQGKWRARTTYGRLRRLRRQLAEVRVKLGGLAEPTALEPRLGAGQRPVGPLPIPSPKDRKPRIDRTLCSVIDRSFTAQEVNSRYSWYFRAGLASRDIDRTPLFTCIGLEA